MPGTALWRVTPCLKHNSRMSEAQQQVAQPVMDTAEGITVYEQPLNERMRTFMRLDFLYNQALYQSEIATAESARAAMTGLLDILAITTRSDMRSDALKELERHLNHMNEFQSRPGVDAARLKTVIANLGRDVAGSAHQHVDVALHLQDPDVIRRARLRGRTRLRVSANGRQGGNQYQRGFTLHSKSPRQRQ